MKPEQEGAYFMTEQRMGVEIMPVTIAAQINLGPNDEGNISVDHLPEDVVRAAIEDCAKLEFQRKPTNRWRCVDGRFPEGGLTTVEGYSDPQIAGSLPINDSSVDIMTGEADPVLSTTIVRNTQAALANGQKVAPHGDDHAKKAGCGANKHQRNMLAANAANADIVAPVAVAAIDMAGLTQYWSSESELKDDISGQILAGKAVADNDAFWDVTPEQVTDLIIENGGEYEELVGPHLEGLAKVELETDSTLDSQAFARAHEHDGQPIEAFVASLGIYAKYTFARAEKEGRTPQWAARRILATILAHVGTLKKLTRDLPIVITK